MWFEVKLYHDRRKSVSTYLCRLVHQNVYALSRFARFHSRKRCHAPILKTTLTNYHKQPMTGSHHIWTKVCLGTFSSRPIFEKFIKNLKL